MKKNVRDSHKTVSTNHNLSEEEGGPKWNQAEALLLYLPNALALGQADSQYFTLNSTGFIV